MLIVPMIALTYVIGYGPRSISPQTSISTAAQSTLDDKQSIKYRLSPQGHCHVSLSFFDNLNAHCTMHFDVSALS